MPNRHAAVIYTCNAPSIQFMPCVLTATIQSRGCRRLATRVELTLAEMTETGEVGPSPGHGSHST
jgi:hypothetical protein